MRLDIRKLAGIYVTEVAATAAMARDLESLTDEQFKEKHGCSKDKAKQKTLKDVKEAADGLTGAALVDHLTSICMSSWYSLVQKFSGRPDVFDIQPSQDHEKYKVMKMTPGKDVRGDVYETLVSTTTALTDKLNSAFGSEVFEPRISRTEGNLETLVAFVQNKGGVFQAKATNNGGDSTIYITMPVEEELNRAFSAMTSTPVPQENDPIDSNVSDPAYAPDPVAGDPVPAGDDFEENEFEVDFQDDDEEETRFDYPRESVGGFVLRGKKSLTEADVKSMSDAELNAEFRKLDDTARWTSKADLLPLEKTLAANRRKKILAELKRRKAQQSQQKVSVEEAAEQTYNIRYMDNTGKEATTTITALSDGEAKRKANQMLRGARNITIEKQVTESTAGVNKHNLDQAIEIVHKVESQLNQDIADKVIDHDEMDLIVGATPKLHSFKRSHKTQDHEIRHADEATLIVHARGENWFQIEAKYTTSSGNRWLITHIAKNFDGSVVSRRKEPKKVKAVELYSAIYDEIEEIKKAGWKQTYNFTKKKVRPRMAPDGKSIVHEEAPANSVAGGGVAMPADAGKKKKKKTENGWPMAHRRGFKFRKRDEE
jgi:hypothetical protein